MKLDVSIFTVACVFLNCYRESSSMLIFASINQYFLNNEHSTLNLFSFDVLDVFKQFSKP